MNGFTQQVADALRNMPIPSSAGTRYLDARHVAALAPRVVAAIQAAMWCTASHGHVPDGDAALAALQEETP